MHPEPRLTPKREIFTKIVIGFLPLTVSAESKKLILDVWLGSGQAFVTEEYWYYKL